MSVHCCMSRRVNVTHVMYTGYNVSLPLQSSCSYSAQATATQPSLDESRVHTALFKIKVVIICARVASCRDLVSKWKADCLSLWDNTPWETLPPREYPPEVPPVECSNIHKAKIHTTATSPYFWPYLTNKEGSWPMGLPPGGGDFLYWVIWMDVSSGSYLR